MGWLAGRTAVAFGVVLVTALTLAEIGDRLPDLVADALDGDWTVYAHEWVDGLHPPCVIVGPAARMNHRGSTITVPTYTFVLRVWVDPNTDGAVALIHEAIDKGSPGSIVDAFEASAAAATWALFMVNDTVSVDSIDRGQGTYLEALIPITVTPRQ